MTIGVADNQSTALILRSVLYWSAGISCAIYVLCLLRKRRKTRKTTDVSEKVESRNPRMSFPIDDFRAVASAFEGLYELLHVSVDNGDRTSNALLKWQKRVDLHGGAEFGLLRMYFSKNMADAVTTVQKIAFAKRLLSGLYDAGVRRDERSSIVLGDEMPDGYFIEDSVDFERGDAADVKHASWRLDGKLIEKGVLVVRKTVNATNEKEK